MPKTLVGKIVAAHLVSGRAVAGEEIALRIDQTLTQDATGTLAFLQFEALGLDRTRARLSVSYVDHNTLQAGPENADDHRYLETAAARYGVWFSRPGNGICHQVHLERFAVPGGTLLGSDSHTPTCGGLGMLAIGAGGLDVAAAMAGEPFFLAMPAVVLVNLEGKLPPWVSAKDVILELLRRFGVKWGRGKALEYGGPALASLTVPERATIANMGTELGLTSSVFPADAQAKRFLAAQGRLKAWRPLAPDEGAAYAGTVRVNLAALEPLVATPHSPDRVRPARALAGTRVDQVCIGSCTNSSLRDMLEAAAMLRGHRIAPGVSLTVSPGSRQVLRMLAVRGALDAMLAAGARLLENACGPCIGMGQAPPSGGVSLRTFNRNFRGRAGTPDAGVYLCGVATAIASAVAGEITDPRCFGRRPAVKIPARFLADDAMLIPPPRNRRAIEVVKGPNIKPLPRFHGLADRVEGEVMLALGDNITTDDIIPAGAKFLPLRSNIPALAAHAFGRVAPGFPARARAAGTGVIVAGENYGQGSSREHAALVPRFLGIAAVIARSFARIHLANLVNYGIVPLVFDRKGDLAALRPGDRLLIKGVREAVRTGERIAVHNRRGGAALLARLELSPRARRILLAGGLLNDIGARASRGSRNARRADGDTR